MNRPVAQDKEIKVISVVLPQFDPIPLMTAYGARVSRSGQLTSPKRDPGSRATTNPIVPESSASMI